MEKKGILFHDRWHDIMFKNEWIWHDLLVVIREEMSYLTVYQLFYCSYFTIVENDKWRSISTTSFCWPYHRFILLKLGLFALQIIRMERVLRATHLKSVRIHLYTFPNQFFISTVRSGTQISKIKKNRYIVKS